MPSVQSKFAYDDFWRKNVHWTYTPKWAEEHSSVFSNMMIYRSDEEDPFGSEDEEEETNDEPIMVKRCHQPCTFKYFKRHCHGKSLEEVRFLYFLHYLRLMDFWDVEPKYWPLNLLSYIYYNYRREYRDEIPRDLRENLLASFSFGEYIGMPIHWRDLPSLAIEMGNLPFLKMMKDKGHRFNEYTFQNAVGCGDMEICKYLLSEGCKFNSYTTATAALQGHFEILKFLVENGCPMTSHVITNASINGHLDIIKWAKENGVKTTIHACWGAINGDHREVFEFLHKECGIRLDDNVILKALKRCLRTGKTNVFKYIHENGDARTVKETIEMFDPQTVMELVILRRFGRIFDEETIELIDNPQTGEEMEILLRDFGKILDERFIRCITRYGTVEVMKYLLENGLVKYNTVFRVIENHFGNIEMTKYFDENFESISDTMSDDSDS